MFTQSKSLAPIAMACVLVLVFTGCPLINGGTAKVTTLLTAGTSTKSLAGAVAAKADVPMSDIESLWITLSKIELIPADGSGPVELVQDPVDINLMENVVLSVSEVQAGVYNQMRLSYSDPRMTLKSDPGTEITDIHQTANSRLFITQLFNVPAGATVFQFDLNGAKIVQLGHGGYNWTPQLDVELSAVAEDVTAEGEIVAIDGQAKTVTIQLETGTLVVDYSGADIYLPDDTDTPNGTEGDLAIGKTVLAEGDVTNAGPLVASAVYIQAAAPAS